MKPDIYCCFARILPPLLGLGLIELYFERDMTFATVVVAVAALGVVMIVVAALAAPVARISGRAARR